MDKMLTFRLVAQLQCHQVGHLALGFLGRRNGVGDVVPPTVQAW